MPDAIFIEKAPTLEESQNYALLREVGIKQIEQLTHEIWTDYNAHDPGITFLDLLCYAITDLGFRTGYEMKDLLTELVDNNPEIVGEFHTARYIFPSKPVSFNDIRKWLIDINGVHNAWINKHTSIEYCLDKWNKKLKDGACGGTGKETLPPLNGLFDVLLEFEDFVAADPRILRLGERERTASAGFIAPDNKGIVFRVKYPVELQAVHVYPNVAASAELEMRLSYQKADGTFDDLEMPERPDRPAKKTITPGDNDNKTRIPLGWNLVPEQTYLLQAKGAGIQLSSNEPGNYPPNDAGLYHALGIIELQKGFPDQDQYYFFYDWEVSYAVSPLAIQEVNEQAADVWRQGATGLPEQGEPADGQYLTVASKGLEFNVYGKTILSSVDVYPESAGNIKVRLLDKDENVLEEYDETVGTPGQLHTLMLNWDIEPGLHYTIDAKGSTTKLYKDEKNGAYPFSLPGALEIFAGRISASTTSNDQYYFFYNWQFKYQAFLPQVSDLTRQDLQLAVKERLHQVRNLCEDFVTIHYLKVEEIGLCADVEVTPDADIEEILAEVYYQMESYVSPPVNFYTIEELKKKGRTTDVIFEGPLLDHGFIDDEEFRQIERRCFLSVSDVVKLLLDIDHVKTIKEIFLLSYVKTSEAEAPKGAQKVTWQGEQYWAVQQPWILELQNINAFAPNFNPLLSNVTFYKNGLPYLPDKGRVLELYEEKRAQNFQNKIKEPERDLPKPVGEHKELGDYFPFQNELPATYRAGRYRVPDTESTRRKAQARQLKTFLLFFEQLLANYLSQLANLKQLFSWETGNNQTYFTQKLDAGLIADLEESYFDYTNLQSELESIIETKAVAEERKNRFLDHLLGRFCEDFTEYGLMMYSLYKEKANQRTIFDKQCFLANYPAASDQRGRAFDYRFPFDPDNLSGFQHRLYRLLGIHHTNDCYVSRRNFANPNLKMVDLGSDQWAIRLMSDEEMPDILFESNPDYECVGKLQMCGLLDNLIIFAAEGETYEDPKKQFDNETDVFDLIIGHWRHNVTQDRWELFRKCVFEEEEELQVFGYTTSSISSLEDFEQKVHEVFKELAHREGFHVVEHILLRKRTLDDPFMPVELPADPCNCVEVKDPYSFRATIFLPSWPERFQHIRFRQYVEKTLRLESPAHVYLKICWISHCEMIDFEEIHDDWLEQHARLKDDFKGAFSLKAADQYNALEEQQMNSYTTVLQKMIKVLHNRTNVFPMSILHDCKTVSGDEPRISLNNTSLGSL